MTTKRPAGFYTFQILTAVTSSALFGTASFLAQSSAVEQEEEARIAAEQQWIIDQAVAAQVAAVTSQQQAQVDAAMATVTQLQDEL
jgi:hypothetical protein